jgi:integration host factor subunit beta
MTKNDLIEILAGRNNLTNKQSFDIVNLVFNSFTNELENDGRIDIREFGTFSVKKYGAYIGTNPKTGTPIEVKPKKLPVFKMSKVFNEYLNYITPKKIDKLIHYCNSYDRLPTLIDAYYSDKISLDELFMALRDNWTSFDNISRYMVDLEDILESGYRTIYLMMDKKEQEYFEELPDTVTIYRGCDEQNQSGICWSLDRDIAIEFPFLHRYKAKNPVLVTATVCKDEIVAVKLNRDEFEVIFFSPETTMVTPLTEADRNPKTEEEKRLKTMELLH